MNAKQIAMLKSATRHLIVTTAALYGAGVHDYKALAFGVLAAIAGPAIRGIDKQDPAFGRVADLIVAEIDKLARKSSKTK